jgi:hypothetical protein
VLKYVYALFFERSKPLSADITIINREHWLTELALRLEPMVQGHNKRMPKRWRISCSFPASRARPSAAKAKHRIGECWAEHCSAAVTPAN